MTGQTDRRHYSPAYLRITEDLKSRIRQGRWPVGAMLPSRHSLAREYGVALVTMQRAVEQLTQDGTLQAHPGRGTFVASPPAPADAGASAGAGAGRTMSGLPTMARHAADSAQPQSLASATVAIVVPVRITEAPAATGEEPWEPLVVRAVERVIAGVGGRTRFFSLDQPDKGGPVCWGEAVRRLAAEHASAIVVIEIYDYAGAQSEIVSAAVGLACPLVYVTWRPVPYFIPHVYYDARHAGYQAAEHLLKSGYRRLVFFQPFTAQWVRDRLAGARDAARRSGLAEDSVRAYPGSPGLYPPGADPVEVGYRAARKALAAGVLRPPSPGAKERTGVIAVNDHTAYGVLRAATEVGLTPGRDFGLIGFDDAPQSRVVGLTSVRPPLDALGEEAGHLVARALAGDASALQVGLRSLLVPRASTCLQAAGAKRRARREA